MQTCLPIHEQYPAKIAEFRDEIEAEQPGWIRHCRLEYLWDEMFDLYCDLCEVYERYQKSTKKGESYFCRLSILIASESEKKEAKLQKLIKQYRFLLLNQKNIQRKDSITDEMIEQAKNHPIENLIEVNRYGYALCPFHADKHPSFYIKKNFGYCFSCCAHADSISLFMKLNGVDFVTAVQALSQGG